MSDETIAYDQNVLTVQCTMSRQFFLINGPFQTKKAKLLFCSTKVSLQDKKYYSQPWAYEFYTYING